MYKIENYLVTFFLTKRENYHWRRRYQHCLDTVYYALLYSAVGPDGGVHVYCLQRHTAKPLKPYSHLGLFQKNPKIVRTTELVNYQDITC